MPLSDGKTQAIYFSRARNRLEFTPGLLFLKTSIKQLEIIQNRGARLITDCLGSSRIQSLLLEAGLLPLEMHFQYQCMVAAEKCRRLPLSDPLQRRAFTCPGEGPRVFSWREKAEALYKENKIQLYQNEENSAVALKSAAGR